MRTTIDLPDDLHALARQLAHESNRSMSEVIAELIRLGMRRDRPARAWGRRGMPVLSVGRPITAEDVRSLDDDA
ncbi:MAG: antitoxin [Acidimicrobiales bacterium]